MKRILIGILAVIILTLSCGCKPADDGNVSVVSEEKSKFSDIETLVKEGKISDTEAMLGETQEDVKKIYEADGIERFSTNKGNLELYTTDSSLRILFAKEDDYAFVKGIAALCDLYGIKIGETTESEIKAEFPEMTSFTPPTDDFYFFFYSKPENCTALDYTSGQNNLKLYFSDGKFCGALLSAQGFSYIKGVE